MNTTVIRRTAGASLIELIGAVVLFTIVIIGVLNHVVLQRALIYHTQVKSAALSFLNDTILNQQDQSVGDHTITVPTDLQPYVDSMVVTITTNTIAGTIIWHTALAADSSIRYTNSATLTLVPP